MVEQAQFDVAKRWLLYEQMARLPVYQAPAEEEAAAPATPPVEEKVKG